MATVLDIVTRAYRKINVTAQDEDLNADDISVGVDAFNMMLHAWKLAGVDTEHTDVTSSDTFPLADEYQEGTVYLLASRLSPDYVRPQAFDADDWFRKMQAAYMEISASSVPTSLTRTPSRYWPHPRIR
ncbi:hypothetical protein [Roseovarius sp. MMSF_3350]|uniref:hypothetical protein n=1 Tax=Roseovarius sp. MMSF_3350 TaxID=3046706 RepID=UPI00273CFF52|nr:hypothetical protein [Roseovarius sp. MMSF_3350]